MRTQYGSSDISRYGRCSSTRRTLAAAMLGVALIAVQLTPAFAQNPGLASPASQARDGYALTKSAVEDIESLLKNQPDDLAARTKLLGFYFRGAARVYPREVTIEARRR